VGFTGKGSQAARSLSVEALEVHPTVQAVSEEERRAKLEARGASMSEKEMILMLQVLLSFVEEIKEGKQAPGPWAIQQRLRTYKQNAEQLLKNTP
jgi:hypothetical protein